MCFALHLQMSVTKTKRLWDPSPLSMLCSALVYSFARGAALCCVLRKYAKLCFKFSVATVRAFTLSAVLVARSVKIYLCIICWTAFKIVIIVFLSNNIKHHLNFALQSRGV